MGPQFDWKFDNLAGWQKRRLVCGCRTVQAAQVSILVGYPTGVPVVRGPPLGHSLHNRPGGDVEKAREGSDTVSGAYPVLNGANLLVPVEVSSRVSKVVRGRHEAHHLVKAWLGLFGSCFHFVNRPRVVLEDPLCYAITCSEGQAVGLVP